MNQTFRWFGAWLIILLGCGACSCDPVEKISASLDKAPQKASRTGFELEQGARQRWPEFPRPVTATPIPEACGSFQQHDSSCLPSPQTELDLEKEFWLLIGNLDGPNSPAYAGLRDWALRTERYLGYRYTSGFIAVARSYKGPVRSKARLTLLISAANVAMFRAHDIEGLVEALAKGNIVELFAKRSEIPSLYFFVEAIKYADEGYDLDPTQTHASNFLFPTIAFLQLALPIDLDLGAITPNVKGTIGLHRSYRLGWDGAFDSFEQVVSLQQPCSSEACGPSLRSTEGVFTYGMSLENIDIKSIPTTGVRHSFLNPGNILSLADGIYYDAEHGACESYACQATSSIAPFKKIVGLLINAEIRGKMGKQDDMRAIIQKAREHAQAQGFPFMDRIDEVEAKLLGTDSNGSGILRQWAEDKGQTIGHIQFPLPPTNNPKSCSSCHFGGTVRDPDFYNPKKIP